MKTLNCSIWISSFWCCLIFNLLVSNSFAQNWEDSMVTIKGHVIDKTTRKPVSYANVYLANSGIGIVANSEGEFILKIPKSIVSNKITFSLLGYQAVSYNFNELNKEDNIVILSPQSILIKEVLIRSNDPLLLIKNAVANIKDNYGTQPFVATAFYRESIMQNKRFIGVAEAVLGVYKTSYNNNYESDRIKVFKGRKSEDKKYMDTLILKLRGGHLIAKQLDAVKNLPTFMDEQYFSQYNYKPVTLINLEGNESYVIEFEAKNDMPDAMYNGKIYIDINSLAFLKVEFYISPLALNLADNMLILRKPLDMKVKTVSGFYSVDYRNLNGRWTLNHAHYDVKFKVDKRRHFFSKYYSAISDLVITDKDTIHVTRFKYSESLKSDSYFMEQVNNYYDKDFWGAYNIIKPEEAIEVVVEKVSKKMEKLKR